MNLKIYSLLVLTILIIINISTIVFASNDEPTIIRIGYCEDYAMIKSPMLEGYEGYGYEYLEAISSYMDGNYEFEFVVGTWGEGLKRLQEGSIDLLGPANYSDERAEEFIFTQNMFAKESVILTSLDPQYLATTSNTGIENSTIGVVAGDATKIYLEEYLKNNNITATIEETNISNFTYELQQQRFDYFLTGSMQMESQLNIILNLGNNPVFLMGNKNSQDIIDKIDYAIEKIEQEEYMLQEQLYFKYFNYDTSKNQYISNEEYELLQSKPVYNVGVTNLYENSSLKNNYDIASIGVDIANFIATKASININLVEINSKTTQLELEMLDFYFPINEYYYSDANKQSQSYMKTPLTIIEKSYSGLKSHGMLGMPSYYGFGHESTHYLMTNQGFTFYDDIDEIIADFKNDYLSKMILTESTYRLLYQEISDIEHTTTTTEFEIGPKIIFSNYLDEDKIDIFNKVISYINEENIEVYIIKNLFLISELERAQLLRSYEQLFLLVAFVSIILIIVYIRKMNNTNIEKISTHDKLTGLFTQHKFNELSKQMLKENLDKNYTMLTLDIDKFKYINEIYGYEIGSNILIHVTNCIQKIIGKETLFSRISGDNFVLIYEKNDKILDDIVSLTNNNSILYDRITNLVDKSYLLTFSIGYYDIKDNTLDINYMMDSCNIAKSYSKGQVGTCVSIFVEEMREQEDLKNNIESNMHKAIQENEFVVYYQPKFDIETKNITGAEALVRWKTENKIVPPNDFIPLFEKNGFIKELDFYVLNEVCKFINENKDIDIPQISVNLSGITIMKKNLVEKIIFITKKNAIKPHQLDLEVTESAFVDHFDIAVNKIEELRNYGFTISMDDFGTGISSLGRLKEISIDVLKIDREFIMESFQHEKAQTIIKNVIKMPKELNLKTIAEGIETKEQLDFLREAGCDVGQGFYVAKPLTSEEFIEKLLKK